METHTLLNELGSIIKAAKTVSISNAITVLKLHYKGKL